MGLSGRLKERMHIERKMTGRTPYERSARRGKSVWKFGAGEGRKVSHLFSGDEEYGIGILKVKEIIGMMRITPVPQTPDFVRGVINLRGKVIPVIDLRLRFGMNENGYTERTCIVVVEIDSSEAKLHIGVVVDSVSEVLSIKGADIEDTPSFGTALKTDYILGMAKTGGGVKILLDIDSVLSNSELSLLDKVA